LAINYMPCCAMFFCALFRFVSALLFFQRPSKNKIALAGFIFPMSKNSSSTPFFRSAFLSEKNHCPPSTFVRTAFQFLNT
ncbi:hypothetical protein K8089_16320, partial [Aequorivita sp. F47161]